MRIIADDKIPFLKGVLEPFADVDYFPGDKISNEIVKECRCHSYPYTYPLQ